MITAEKLSTRPEIMHQGHYPFASGNHTRVTAVRYSRSEFTSRTVVFGQPTNLLEWCQGASVSEAINGGFTLYHREKRPTVLLGEYVYNSVKLPGVPFHTPRSGVHVDSRGRLRLVHHTERQYMPAGDFFEAGPMLIKDGEILVDDNFDYEGVASRPLQLDDDWTKGRFPRAAIGTDDQFIVTFTSGGYARPGERGADRGLTLEEVAYFMASIGMKDVLNLDGGSKATHISGGEIINRPRGGRGDNYRFFPAGLPVMSAIVFLPKPD